MVEDGQNVSTEEWLAKAQTLVPVALHKALEVKLFLGRWKTIISKLEQIPVMLSDLSSHPCFSKNILCKEQLQTVVKTLSEVVELAELCVKEKYEGKLRMQSDLDSVSGKLDLNLRDCGVLIKTAVLNGVTSTPLASTTPAEPDAVAHYNIRELLARLQIGHLEAKHRALDNLLEAMHENENNVLAFMGRSDVATFVQLLTTSSSRIREKSVTVICALAESGTCDNWLEVEGVLPPLIRLVESGSAVCKEKATISLQRLSISVDMARLIVGHGGARPLIDVCQTQDSVAQSAAACTLKNISSVPDVRQILVEEGIVKVMIGLLNSGILLGSKEYAAECLQNLTSANDPKSLSGISVPDNVVRLLLSVSSSSVLDKALECLIGTAKSADGRSELSSKNVVPSVVQLCKSLSYPSDRLLILLALKLLRNLCAGEVLNQNSFLEEDGVSVTLCVVSNAQVGASPDCEIIRMALQLLGNVTLAGVTHKLAVWKKFVTHEFHEIAKIRTSDICDPLCMILYTVCNGTDRLAELCSDEGILIVIEILKTATVDGFKEEWLKMLFSRICLENSQFQPIFTKLDLVSAGIKGDSFAAEQAFLLSVLSETLSENMEDLIVNCDFALAVLQILRSAHQIVDFSVRGKLSLPTGNADVDVLGYSLIILRDMCACDGVIGHKEKAADVVDILSSNGLIGLLIDLLRELEAPALIRKAMSQSEPSEGKTSQPSKCCPYKGFRRDIISIVGNCSYKRKRVQDEIREKNGIVLLLQQCGADEDNPFLREWGIWSMRNILENNPENQKIVSDLELQGSVDVPEIAQNGLRVEVDPTTRRAKLVNTSSR